MHREQGDQRGDQIEQAVGQAGDGFGGINGVNLGVVQPLHDGFAAQNDGTGHTAHALIKRDTTGLPTLDAAPDTPHRHRLIRLAFLAPDLQQAILAGQNAEADRLYPLVHAELESIIAAVARHTADAARVDRSNT